MKTKFVASIAFFYFFSSAAYGQSIAGKWQTDLAAAVRASQGQPAPGAAGQAVVLDLNIDASNKISGTVNEIGNGDPLAITEGTVTGKTFTFKTNRELSGNTITVTWNGEMTGDDTLTVTRALPPRGGAPGARGRGGFAGGAPVDPAPGGISRGGAPPPPPPPRGGATGALVFHRAPK